MLSGISGQTIDFLVQTARTRSRLGRYVLAWFLTVSAALLTAPIFAEYSNELDVPGSRNLAPGLRGESDEDSIPTMPAIIIPSRSPVSFPTATPQPQRRTASSTLPIHPPTVSPGRPLHSSPFGRLVPNGYRGHAAREPQGVAPASVFTETPPQNRVSPAAAFASSGDEDWITPSDHPQSLPHSPSTYTVPPVYPTSVPPAYGTITPGMSIDDDWIILPDGLLYRSYIAGVKEARFASVWLWEKDRGLVWESVLGGRMGVVRYGTPDHVFGEGFQLDMEGGAFARVDPTLDSAPLEGTDFRFGLIGTWRFGALASKFGYYHLSSHVGDEYMVNNPGFVRVNYVRDSLLWGLSYDMTEDVRVYSEIGYAIGHEGGALPLEFQFGVEYNPVDTFAFRGAPFGAINGHFREDFGWIGSVNMIAGWQWRGPESKHALRLGFQFYSGPAMQYEFLDRYERLAGVGIWYDF